MRKVLNPKTLALFIGFLCLIMSNLHAQYAWTPYETTWTTVQTQDDIKIEYSAPVKCEATEAKAEYFFLRLSNLSSTTKTVSFRIDYYYKGTGCATCNNDEYQLSFEIPANGVLQGDCNFLSETNIEMRTNRNKLAIFKQFLSKKNYTEFEKFEISNITVR